MIEILKGYPDEILAISGSGRITSDDYRKVLAPEAEGRIGRHGSVRILYYLGPKYQSFSSSAVWSDLLFGLSNWSKIRPRRPGDRRRMDPRVGPPLHAVLPQSLAHFRLGRSRARERMDSRRMAPRRETADRFNRRRDHPTFIAAAGTPVAGRLSSLDRGEQKASHVKVAHRDPASPTSRRPHSVGPRRRAGFRQG